MLKTALFVDAINIYKKDVTVDFTQLRGFCKRGKRLLTRATAYVIVDRDKPETTRPFIDYVRNHGYKVVEKPLKRLSNGAVKADADVEIATDMLVQSENIDVVVLVSGDGDFTYVVHQLQAKGKRVEVIAFPDRISRDLRQTADRYISLDEIPNIFRPPKAGIDATSSMSEKREKVPEELDYIGVAEKENDVAREE